MDRDALSNKAMSNAIRPAIPYGISYGYEIPTHIRSPHRRSGWTKAMLVSDCSLDGAYSIVVLIGYPRSEHFNRDENIKSCTG